MNLIQNYIQKIIKNIKVIKLFTAVIYEFL
jgi:hypothetical protein